MEIGPLVSRNLLSVRPQHSLAHVARAMNERNVGSAIVLVEDGRPGIITERDILRAIAEGVDPQTTPAENYMSANAITAIESWDVDEAARCMMDGKFRHLIVLDGSGAVRGLLSIRDLTAALLDELADARASSR